MRIQHQFTDSKDFLEKGGDFCLKIGRKAFGFQKVGSLSTEPNPTVEKIKA